MLINNFSTLFVEIGMEASGVNYFLFLLMWLKSLGEKSMHPSQTITLAVVGVSCDSPFRTSICGGTDGDDQYFVSPFSPKSTRN